MTYLLSLPLLPDEHRPDETLEATLRTDGVVELYAEDASGTATLRLTVAELRALAERLTDLADEADELTA